MSAVRVAAFLLSSAIVTHVAARDFWLEAAMPASAKSDELTIHLEAGERLKAEEEKPLQKDRITRFDLYGDRTARRDLLATGQDNQLPVARTRLEAGSALVVMDRKPRWVVMDPAKFNQYLTEEGFPAIIAQRARLGQADAGGRETYTRYLKTLVEDRSPGAVANTLYKRRMGQKLEILLENDPDRLNPSGKLTVKVLFDGNPLAGVKVSACDRGTDDHSQRVLSMVTSAKGTADFNLDRAGLWLVRTVYLRAADGGPKAEAPWESFWATYTFAARFAPTAVTLSETPAPTELPSR